MTKQKEEDIREFNRIYKELDKIYHEIALGIGISDSAFTIFCIINELGDGCLQTDICQESCTNKQTINSSIRKLEKEGYIYLVQGRGRDKHIHLTEAGKGFVHEHIQPVIQREHDAFLSLNAQERRDFLRLSRKYMESFKCEGNGK